MLATDRTGRADTAAALGGSLGGLTAAALLERRAPLAPLDAAALPIGAGFGALIGGLAPSLGQPTFSGFDSA